MGTPSRPCVSCGRLRSSIPVPRGSEWRSRGLLRDTGKVDEAIPEAREAVRLAPDDPEILVVLAQTLQFTALARESRRQESGRGGGDLREGRGCSPGRRRVAPGPGPDLHPTPEASRCRRACGRSTWSSIPGSFDANLQLGTQLLQTGDTDRAAAALKQALELQPDSVQGASEPRRGLRAGTADRPGGAPLPEGPRERARERAAAPHSRGCPAPGQALRGESLVEAQAVFDVDADNRYALDLRGRALRDMRRLDEAEKVAERLIGLDPNDLKSRYLDMTIAEARRDYAAAAQKAETVLGSTQGYRGSRRRCRQRPDLPRSPRLRLPAARAGPPRPPRPSDGPWPRARPIPTSPATTSRHFSSPRTPLVRWRRLARLGSASRPTRLSRSSRRAPCARWDARRRRSPSCGRCAREHPTMPKVLGEIADYYRRGRLFAEAEAALARGTGGRSSFGGGALPARGRSRTAEAPRRRRGRSSGRPSGSSPTRHPS